MCVYKNVLLKSLVLYKSWLLSVAAVRVAEAIREVEVMVVGATRVVEG